MEITDKLVYSATQVANTAGAGDSLAQPILFLVLVVVGIAGVVLLSGCAPDQDELDRRDGATVDPYDRRIDGAPRGTTT